MPAAALPDDELWRLAALWDLQILDTGQSALLDAIVRAASLVCGTPIALISLVDEHRQWFKAKTGVGDLFETPREVAFCAHAILADTVLEVSNAPEDPRFSDNPLVLGDPQIRFYAGAPLTLSDGSKIGTLCAIDTKPHYLNDRQRQIMQELAFAATRAMEQERALGLQREVVRRLRAKTDVPVAAE
jgi:GAF domain-containing protein